MDESTQQNAALVEEAAAAAESLVEQANGLMGTVNQYRRSQAAVSTSRASAASVAAQKTSVDRRAVNSPMRNSQSTKVSDESSSKTGTDEDWEEF